MIDADLTHVLLAQGRVADAAATAEAAAQAAWRAVRLYEAKANVIAAAATRAEFAEVLAARRE
jgi:hypothetical protein